MVKRTGPTNTVLKKLIEKLKVEASKNNAKIWKDVAKKLEKPTRKRIHVNLYRINKHSKDGDTILVPGVVLSVGELDKKITIAAWKFSKKAKEKIEKSGSKAISIEDLIKTNKKGKNVKIMV